MTSREFQDRLARRARRAGVMLSGELGVRLETYYRLLAAWNRKINLTGLDLSEGAPETLDRLLVEPLVASRYCPAGSRAMIDIGSGGGSPAIPFALSVPGLSLLLVESKVRKSVFLREAIRALEMREADVATARYETLLSQPTLHEAHDLLTIRAVRLEMGVLMGLQAFLKIGGLLFLFQGPTSSSRSEHVTPPLAWRATYPLIEPLRSRLVVIEKRPVGRHA